jgi:hypothetical protein
MIILYLLLVAAESRRGGLATELPTGANNIWQKLFEFSEMEPKNIENKNQKWSASVRHFLCFSLYGNRKSRAQPENPTITPLWRRN